VKALVARLLLTALLSICAATADAQDPGTIAEIRVHGNHTTPDADILGLAGLAVGQAATEARLREAEARIRASDRFSGVEVRRRYRSIANPSEILIMVVVDEQPAVDDLDLTPGPMKKLRAAGMWLPIVSHADGYGFTYGARVSFIDPIGAHTRLSIPMTWGGDRRVAAELERTFENGPFSSIRGTLSASRRINPFFEIADRRLEAKVRAERVVTGWLRVGGGGRFTDNGFGGLADRTRAAGADITFDTRLDPSFPRDAVYASTGWERMAFDAGRASRWTTDLRGYIGVGGSAVLALRGSLVRVNAPLPPFEQSLLGGSGTLRGYRTGHSADDNMATASAEARVPLNSPLSTGRFGVKAFVDAGTTWASGRRLSDQRFEHGIGGGLYFGAGPVLADLDVAWPEQGKPRAHFGLGVSF
jgi:outer membrane protein assembly factor BamA